VKSAYPYLQHKVDVPLVDRNLCDDQFKAVLLLPTHRTFGRINQKGVIKSVAEF
jgi:hypothetical protein